MAEYTAANAQKDLDQIGALNSGESVQRLERYIERLETRLASAECVCEAAAEVVAPSVKRDLVQQRQTRFLRALAEWRAEQPE